MFDQTQDKPTKFLSLKRPDRCAARCGALRAGHDIYCQACREEITGEAWLLIQLEEVPGV